MIAARNFIARYQLPIYFLLTYLLSWLIAPFMNGQLMPQGPAVAAVIVLALSAGRSGLKALWRLVTNWRVAWYWYLIGPAIILGYQVLALLINSLLGATLTSPPRLTLGIIIELVLVGGWWEEIGWTGYALPKLQQHFSHRPNSPLIAALVLGVFRSIWHLPLFLYGHIPWFDILFFEVAMQLLIAWIFFGSRGSLPAVMLFHFSSNVIGALFSQVYTWTERTMYYATFMALACLVVLVIVWRAGPTLGKGDAEYRYPDRPPLAEEQG